VKLQPAVVSVVEFEPGCCGTHAAQAHIAVTSSSNAALLDDEYRK